MLSNVSIEQLLSSGDIVIRPWQDEMMDACRVTLHLGQRLLLPKPGKVVDVRAGIVPDYDEMSLTEAISFKLEPGMFVLGETLEEIGLSERGVSSLLDGRSTLARVGLSVTQTAAIIDSGQAPKRMTLEMLNAGPNPIMLYIGMKVARACFFEMNPPADMRHDTDAQGKYLAGDSNKPIFKKEF